MNIIQEHISTLLSEETIKKVKAQFQSGTGVVNIDSYGSDYRLKKYLAGNIVLPIATYKPVFTNADV